MYMYRIGSFASILHASMQILQNIKGLNCKSIYSLMLLNTHADHKITPAQQL